MTILIELELPKGSKKQVHEIEVDNDLRESEIDEKVYEYVDSLIHWTWEKREDDYWENVLKPDREAV